MMNETVGQGYILLHDPGSDSWLACRFDYQVTDDPRWEFLNPKFKIQAKEGDPFDDGFVSVVTPDVVTGTTLKFVDPDGKPHELTARAPGPGKMIAVQTLGGPQEALSMLLEEL